MNTLAEMCIVFVFVVLYLLPALVARIRRHRNAEGITVLTLLFSWTVITWTIALLVACGPNVERQPQ